MWTLAQMRHFSHEAHLEPIVGLSFADADRQLYACARSGTVLCWQSRGGTTTAPPRRMHYRQLDPRA